MMKRFFLRSVSWLRLVRRLPHLRNFVRLLWRLVRDRRVPLYLKGMLGLTILYVLSPIDLIPVSVALMFGLIDDVAILMMGVNWFLRLAPQHVVDAHLRTLSPDFQQSFQKWRGNQQPLRRVNGTG
jgi:uncharacterized membrane protein YkvA (DUF1232 family)